MANNNANSSRSLESSIMGAAIVVLGLSGIWVLGNIFNVIAKECSYQKRLKSGEAVSFRLLQEESRPTEQKAGNYDEKRYLEYKPEEVSKK
ncbi:hypothetical protein HYT23_01125 [Candidatus Pacearchaeota archaeon]|nr:hypothetical protein [Candidatus Pacearchaeota archaeon]